MSLVNTINLSFQMTKVLTYMEVHGIKINVDTLHKLRDDYQMEMIVLKKKLDTMIIEAMGILPLIWTVVRIGLLLCTVVE